MSKTLIDRFARKPFNFLSLLYAAGLVTCFGGMIFVLIWSGLEPYDKIGVALIFAGMMFAISLILMIGHLKTSESLAETEDAKRWCEWLADTLMRKLLDMLPPVGEGEMAQHNRKHQLLSVWGDLLRVDPKYLDRTSAIELARQLEQRWPALVPEIIDGERRYLLQYEGWRSILNEVVASPFT